MVLYSVEISEHYGENHFILPRTIASIQRIEKMCSFWRTVYTYVRSKAKLLCRYRDFCVCFYKISVIFPSFFHIFQRNWTEVIYLCRGRSWVAGHWPLHLPSPSSSHAASCPVVVATPHTEQYRRHHIHNQRCMKTIYEGFSFPLPKRSVVPPQKETLKLLRQT